MKAGCCPTCKSRPMITFVQEVNWEFVAVRVDELGGPSPPQVIEMEITEEMLTALATLPDSPALSAGLTVYAENCAACHGANVGGGRSSLPHWIPRRCVQRPKRICSRL